MTGYHVTTAKKAKRYKATGAILPPVRFWPNEYTAMQWAKRTGREMVAVFDCDVSYPLPDHRPARFTPEIIREYRLRSIKGE